MEKNVKPEAMNKNVRYYFKTNNGFCLEVCKLKQYMIGSGFCGRCEHCIAINTNKNWIICEKLNEETWRKKSEELYEKLYAETKLVNEIQLEYDCELWLMENGYFNLSTSKKYFLEKAKKKRGKTLEFIKELSTESEPEEKFEMRKRFNFTYTDSSIKDTNENLLKLKDAAERLGKNMSPYKKFINHHEFICTTDFLNKSNNNNPGVYMDRLRKEIERIRIKYKKEISSKKEVNSKDAKIIEHEIWVAYRKFYKQMKDDDLIIKSLKMLIDSFKLDVNPCKTIYESGNEKIISDFDGNILWDRTNLLRPTIDILAECVINSKNNLNNLFNKISNQMKKENINIEIPKGYVPELKDGKITLIYKGDPLDEMPKSWKECGGLYGEYITVNSGILSADDLCAKYDENKNIIPKGLGKPMLALIQLLQLRNKTWEVTDSKPAHKDEFTAVIFNCYNNTIDSCWSRFTSHPIKFSKEAVAKRFMEYHKELLWEARELL